MPGNCYLTPGCDISVLHPLPHHPIALAPMLSYPTELLLYDNNNNNNKVLLNKLPQTIIIFRVIDNTIRFNNAKIKKHTHLVQYVSVVTASNDALTFYFRFEMPNIYYFRTYVYSIVSV